MIPFSLCIPEAPVAEPQKKNLRGYVDSELGHNDSAVHSAHIRQSSPGARGRLFLMMRERELHRERERERERENWGREYR